MYIYLVGYYFVCSLAGGCYRLSAFASNSTFILIPRYEYPAERPLVLSLYCWHHILPQSNEPPKTILYDISRCVDSSHIDINLESRSCWIIPSLIPTLRPPLLWTPPVTAQSMGILLAYDITEDLGSEWTLSNLIRSSFFIEVLADNSSFPLW